MPKQKNLNINECSNRRISVGLGETVPDPYKDFAGKRFDVGLWMDIPDNIDIDQAYDMLFKKLEERLQNKIDERFPILKKQRQRDDEDRFRGHGK